MKGANKALFDLVRDAFKLHAPQIVLKVEKNRICRNKFLTCDFHNFFRFSPLTLKTRFPVFIGFGFLFLYPYFMFFIY